MKIFELIKIKFLIFKWKNVLILFFLNIYVYEKYYFNVYILIILFKYDKYVFFLITIMSRL